MNMAAFYVDAHGELHYSLLNEEGKRVAANPSAQLSDYWTHPKEITVIQAIGILLKLRAEKLIIHHSGEKGGA